MAVFVRAKRVTDPLDDEAKARLCGGDPMPGSASSSGSEHDAPCLSGLVHAFLHTSNPTGPFTPSAGDSDASDSDENATADHSAFPSAETIRDILNPSPDRDRFRLRLLADASDAAEALDGLRSCRPTFRRAVMGRLRAAGYNAGLCKARWESCGGLAAGSHEYIDVVVAESVAGRRYIVDLDFAGEFVIARPTAEYMQVVATLPKVAVARAEEIRRAVRVMADAARRSLRIRGLSVPPWRKSWYMIAKWVGPYRRTNNPLPLPPSTGSTTSEIKCRFVGFQAVPGLIAARTR